MKRTIAMILLALLVTTMAWGQIGKSIVVRAGSPEDHLLLQITAEPDFEKRLQLLGQFVEQFGSSDVVLLGYELYQSTYLGLQDYDHSMEYGEKLVSADPENAGAHANLVRAAAEKGDSDKVATYGERLGQLFQRVRAMAPPPPWSEADWTNRREEWLGAQKSDYEFVEYTLFRTAVGEKDAMRKINYLDRFAAAFPNSAYLSQLPVQYAFAYQQKGDMAKMEEYADKMLASDPNNLAILLLVADSISERGGDLAKATNYAKKVLALMQEGGHRPEGMTDEQWAEQRKVSEGLAHSSLGQTYIRQNRTQAGIAELRAASPLLKSDTFSYVRNLYRLGFMYARLNQLDQARTILTEAVSIPGPYQALSQELLDKVNRARAGRR